MLVLPDIMRSLLRADRQAEVVASIESKVYGDCVAAGRGRRISPLSGNNKSSPFNVCFFKITLFSYPNGRNININLFR